MVDPHPLPRRLEAAGFEGVQVDITRFAFRFRARKPLQSPDNYAQAAQTESSDLSTATPLPA
ncbi:MAG TPA: hypothetical protein VFT88_08550, partial [Acidobacteriaceae bacterium]|nr:hypothetical protein [Acidobacteriaceae bacterium]